MPLLRPSPHRSRLLPSAMLAVVPVVVVLVAFFAPLRTDAAFKYSGLATDADTRVLSGEPTVDGNMGVTSQALGTRAALDVLAGRLPLWNHFEGLGQPLLGEMQSAALFPPTWLMVLPHGQAVEQAFLQLAAGLGTFLFLRRFGLADHAALAGGLLFEVNGVFAWLRNAITNPVALLPWLFFAVELLHGGARGEARGWARAGRIAATAALASAALYAGFPEEVYLYGLLLIVWVLFRAASLSPRQAGHFAADLLLAGLGALALSAPALVAFADFLRQAEVGGHGSGGFKFPFYDASTLIQYFVPYVYGTIFQSPSPGVSGAWSATGGYIGFTPIVLAVAAVFSPGRRPAKLVLLGWIALALGVTHGVPGLYAAFHALPLADVVAVPRYLNTSWIFCFVVLAALFIDDAPVMAPRRLRPTLGLALVFALACLLLATAAAWPVIDGLWATSAEHRALFVAAGTVGGLSILIAGAAWSTRSRAAALSLAGLAVAEAVAWFALPYLSYPRHGRLDLALIAFLKSEAGQQRVVAFSHLALRPNYGSAIGVASLNYDDLPAPRLTAAYIRSRLDPYAGATSLWPADWGLTAEQSLARRDLVHARLDAYGDAGIRFVLSGEGFDRVPPYEVDAEHESGTLPLAAGDHLLLSGRISPDLALPVSAVTVSLEEAASGRLDVELCARSDCASGGADIAALGASPSVALDHEVELQPGSAYTLRLARPAGEFPLALALALHPVAAPDRGVELRGASGRAIEGAAPEVWFTDARLTLAFSSHATRVYRLRHVRDYLSAPGCRLVPATRDRLSASCARPSRLLRLELAMSGWSATVDGGPMPVTTVDGAFQSIDLPAGDSRVVFSYAPHGFGWALLAAALAFAGIAAAGIGSLASRCGRWPGATPRA